MLVKDNKYIPFEDKDFFILLRIGLWQKVEEELSSDPDWEYIYRLSCEQTVQGIVASGLGLYQVHYPSFAVPQNVSERFLSTTANIIQRNIKINQFQSSLCKLLTEKGLVFLVQKGQGVAQFYPNPLLRCSGDIDFLLSEEDYQRARDYLKEISTGSHLENKRRSHIGFYFNDIEVELHSGVFLYNIRSIKRQYERLKDYVFSPANSSSVQIDGAEVPVPTQNANILYIFIHFLKHYYTEGLGLRQLCDWVMVMQACQIEVRKDISMVLNKYDLTAEWKLFSNFVVDYFDILPNAVPLYEVGNHSNSKSIWKTIRVTGNFGHNGVVSQESFLKRNYSRVYSYIQWMRYNYFISWKTGLYVTLSKFWNLISQIPHRFFSTR